MSNSKIEEISNPRCLRSVTEITLRSIIMLQKSANMRQNFKSIPVKRNQSKSKQVRRKTYSGIQIPGLLGYMVQSKLCFHKRNPLFNLGVVPPAAILVQSLLRPSVSKILANELDVTVSKIKINHQLEWRHTPHQSFDTKVQSRL